MRTFAKGLCFAVLAASLSLGAGCGGKKAKCEKAYDHVMDLMSKDENMKAMADSMKSKKDEEVKKCEKETDEKALDCAIAAGKLEDLMKCDMK